MPASVIDGKAIAARIHEESAAIVDELKGKGITPGLAVVIVGDDPASHTYVRSKVKTCGRLGIYSEKHDLPAETGQQELLDLVGRLNDDPNIHGILVQSPLPPQIDEGAIVAAIDPAKDVDGFHAMNVAKLVMDDSTGFVACTPCGCQRLLVESGIPIEGAHVVIIGRSLIVGKSLAMLLMQKREHANASVTVLHSRSKGMKEIARTADILIAAIGQPEFVTGDYIRDGATVIDVGVNRVEDPSTEKGYRIVGDVAYNEAAAKASAITPVPGGVGPMTIAMLMQNTLKACRQIEGLA